MSDYNDSKKYDYDIKDLIEWNKDRHKVQDITWQNHSLNRHKKSKNTKINLGKHENHDWQPLIGPFGPHEGKIICKTCGGKWVAWLPKGSI